MLNPEFKAKWLEALRSGEYKQGKGALAQDLDGGRFFCCLGVACDIDPEVRGWEKTEIDAACHIPGNDGQRYIGAPSPEDMARWGLPDGNNFTSMLHRDPGIVYHDDLARMNDNGRTFAQIADYIEENL